jgi:hypothetical protein
MEQATIALIMILLPFSAVMLMSAWVVHEKARQLNMKTKKILEMQDRWRRR